MVPSNSISEGFAYIWQSKWEGITAIKTFSLPSCLWTLKSLMTLVHAHALHSIEKFSYCIGPRLRILRSLLFPRLSHSLLLSRAALAWLLAAPPNGEPAHRLWDARCPPRGKNCSIRSHLCWSSSLINGTAHRTHLFFYSFIHSFIYFPWIYSERRGTNLHFLSDPPTYPLKTKWTKARNVLLG